MYTTCKCINVVLKMISEPTITEEKENWLKLLGHLKNQDYGVWQAKKVLKGFEKLFTVYVQCTG